jgi:hypothetical protein
MENLVIIIKSGQPDHSDPQGNLELFCEKFALYESSF